MTLKTQRANSGGSGNEYGSVHRSGLATVLAGYGLAGAAIDGVDGRVPVLIALETDDAVDDIVCTMSNEERWFIQAKRSVNDEELQSALKQWAAQPIGDQDTLILATRSVGGYLAGAMRILDARRMGRLPSGPKNDTQHFEKFASKVRAVCGDRTDEILAHARIIAWAVETVSDERADAAVSRLERITSPGSGHVAFRALQGFFQHQAAARTRTSTSDWIQALRDAELDVSVDGLGKEAVERELERRSLFEYCDALASSKDRLDLSLISPRVPEVIVDDFISTINVEFTIGKENSQSDPLTHVIRRTPRLLLRGLPGAGKSEAMRQLAAWLVTSSGAPLPLLIRLRDIASVVTKVEDISLDLLLRASATRGGLLEAPPSLLAAFRSAVAAGHCVFLLDGLDETYEKRGTVAAGIARLLEGLDGRVGVVMTTRESAMDAAEHLRFPVVDLKASDSRRPQVALVETYALSMRREEDRARWVEEHVDIIEGYAKTHSDIWQVPLLSTLASVRVLEGRAPLGSVVELLSDVVEDSVEQWETRRANGSTQSPDPRFNPRMFLDGFAAIGRALNAGSTVTAESARHLVFDALGAWSLPRPAARSISDFVVRFWDETVGVFVDTGEFLQPRSRLFAELGDAYALLRLDSAEDQGSWLGESLDLPSRSNAFCLAAAAEVSIARWLIAAAAAEHGRRRAQAASWLIEFLPGWHHLSDEDTHATMTTLAAAARDKVHLVKRNRSGTILELIDSATESKDESDGYGWRFAVELASLPVSGHQVEEKQSLLAAYETDPDHWAILHALSEMASHPPFDPGDRELISALDRALAFPLPEYRNDGTVRDRFGVLSIENSNEPEPYGLDRVAQRAAQYGPELSPESLSRLWNIAIRLPGGTYEEIRRVLQSRGLESPYASLLEQVALSALPREDFDLDWFAPHLTSGTVEIGDIDPTERWRMTALADLVDRTGIREASYWEMAEAQKLEDATITLLLNATIVGESLDEQAVRRAALDLQRLEGAKRRDTAHYLFTPLLIPRRQEPGRLTESLALDLVPHVAARSRWGSDLARNLLLDQTYESVREAASKASAANWRSASNLAFVRLYNTAFQVAEATDLLDGDAGQRWAAAAFLAANDTVSDADLLLRARGDRDATVRDVAGATLEVVLQADHWTCTVCYTTNSISLFACQRCEHSSQNSMRTHKGIKEFITRMEAEGKASPTVSETDR